MVKNKTSETQIGITNLSRTKAPVFDWAGLVQAIAGRRYNLSLVFVGSSRSRTLNRRFKSKDRPANVLAFPLSPTGGEIFIDLAEAQKNRRRLGFNLKTQVVYLFIHGLLHLKGYRHGSRMEIEEKRIMKALKLESCYIFDNEPPHRHRSGYRHGVNSSRRLRVQERKQCS